MQDTLTKCTMRVMSPLQHDDGLLLILGNRIPRDYFITRGWGQSDITVHAGSYHLALFSAPAALSPFLTASSWVYSGQP